MADRKLINPLIVTGIADAVRAKGKTTEPIKVADLPDAIMNLPEGGGVGEDTSALLDAIGVESREDTGMANGLAIALTDSATEQMWSGERSVADGAPIKDGVAFVSALKGKTMKVNQMIEPSIGTYTHNGVTFVRDGIRIVANGTTTESGNAFYSRGLSLIRNHKYIYVGCNTNASATTYNSYITGNMTPMTSYGGVFVADGDYIFVTRIMNGYVANNVVFTPQLFDLTEMGMESITSLNEFANAFGYASIADLPYIPYQEPNLQSFAPKAVVSKKDGVELGRLDIDLTTIVDADGNQLFPDGELRSAGSVADVVDYANNVAVRGKKMIGRVDMGELSWSLYNGVFYANLNIKADRLTTDTGKPSLLNCAKYTSVNTRTSMSCNSGEMYEYAHNSNPKRIVVCDTSYATASAFKSAMQGVYLEFELATPIDGEAPITKAWYPVQNNGVEEAITDSIVPMNAEIRYRVDTESLLTQSASLLRYSNEVTGANDSSLGNAVKTLTDSYK